MVSLAGLDHVETGFAVENGLGVVHDDLEALRREDIEPEVNDAVEVDEDVRNPAVGRELVVVLPTLDRPGADIEHAPHALARDPQGLSNPGDAQRFRHGGRR